MARILVTEVGGTKDGRVAVAGWSLDGSGMVRPLPEGALDWPAEDAGPHLFQPGNILTIVPAGRPSGRDLPFRREDLVVGETPRRVGEMAKEELAEAIAPGLAPGLAEGFHGWLELGRFVRTGADCPSLVGIAVEPRRFGFEVPRGRTQLRAWLYDGRGQRFNLPVGARWLRQTFRDGGIASLDGLRRQAGRVILRVGLADALPDGRAYALVTNAIFL